MCSEVLSYNRTYFPNPAANDRTNAVAQIGDLSSISECHEDFLLILCAMLFPDCPHGGPTQRPCRSLCDQVEGACRSEYQSATGSDWSLDCSGLSDNGDGRYCSGGEGGKKYSVG